MRDVLGAAGRDVDRDVAEDADAAIPCVVGAVRSTRGRSEPGRRAPPCRRTLPSRHSRTGAGRRSPRRRPPSLARVARRAAVAIRRTPTPRCTASGRCREGRAEAPATTTVLPPRASRRSDTPRSPRRPPGSDVGWRRTPLARFSLINCESLVPMAARTQSPSARNPDPERRAAGELRPLLDQARRRRGRRRPRDDLPRGPRRAPRRRPLPRPGRAALARVAARAARERPVARLVHRRQAGPLDVHRRRVGRPHRVVAGRGDAQGRRRANRARRRALGGPRAARRRHVARGAPRRAERRPARRGRARRQVRRRRRPAARALRRVVRAVPALVGRLRGRREGAAAARRARVRRDLPAADPSDRPHEPQGPQQRGDREARRRRQPVGDRRGGGRTRRDPSRPRHAGGVRAPRRAGARARHRDRARLRDPVLARPPVAEGASRVVPPPSRTARSSTRRTRPRSTRTSTTSTSSRRTGAGCGRRCAT